MMVLMNEFHNQNSFSSKHKAFFFNYIAIISRLNSFQFEGELFRPSIIKTARSYSAVLQKEKIPHNFKIHF